MAILKLDPDCSLSWRDGVPLLSNHRCRRHAEIEPAALAVLGRLAGGAAAEDWAQALDGITGWDRSLHPGALGLVFDHGGLNPQRGTAAQGAALVQLLLRRRLLQDETQAPAAFIAPKTGLLDDAHLGSFHQNVGQYQMVVCRNRNQWRAWHDQKFAPDGRSLQPGPYRTVQNSFLRQRFPDGALTGTRLLDFGCGNGFYSRFFADRGAQVTGIDTAPQLIEMARANVGDRTAAFILADGPLDVVPRLDALAAGSFDAVFMSDVLLLLLCGEHDGQEVPGLDALFSALHRLLRQGGVLYSMEPNPVFWHACRVVGDDGRAMAVVPEYRSPVFNVAPTYDRVLTRMAQAGFLAQEFRHAYHDGADDDEANRAYASEFPLWDFVAYRRMEP